MLLRIGDLARRTNKSTRAVRLYEEMGLLGPITRSDGGQRVYDEDILVRIAWMDKLHALGFSLNEIKGLLDDWTGNEFGPRAMARVRDLFRQKLDDTRTQIRQLQSLEEELQDSLRYLDGCEVCDPCTVLGACSGCEHPHPIETEPTLVAGFHAGTAGNGSGDGNETEK
jgi:DNA-binding transcriptional MerR regulator